MRLSLLVLTVALLLLAIGWLATDGDPVVHRAPGPIQRALDRDEAVALVRSDILDIVAPPESGRQPVADERSAAAKLAMELELRHRGDGPVAFFRRWTDLRQKRSLGIHEKGLVRFRAGEGVQHRGKWTEPNDELACYWINADKQLVRVVIPEEGNEPLYRLHREAQWFERQVDSFRWDAAEMQRLAETVFDPAGEGAAVRREYLHALRAREGPEPEMIDGPFGRELQPLAPNSEYEDRVRAARDAYMAARAEALHGPAAGSQE